MGKLSRNQKRKSEKLKRVMKRENMDFCELDKKSFGDPVIFCDVPPWERDEEDINRQETINIAKRNNLDYEFNMKQGFVLFKNKSGKKRKKTKRRK